jgi:hypothetical protein
VDEAREVVARVAKPGAVALVAVTAVEETVAVDWAAARAAVVRVEEAREGAMVDESSAVRSRCNQCPNRTALACHTRP